MKERCGGKESGRGGRKRVTVGRMQMEGRWRGREGARRDVKVCKEGERKGWTERREDGEVNSVIVGKIKTREGIYGEKRKR